MPASQRRENVRTACPGGAAHQTRIGTEVRRKKIGWSPRGRPDTINWREEKEGLGESMAPSSMFTRQTQFWTGTDTCWEVSLLEIYFEEKWISFHKPHLPIEQERTDSLETILLHFLLFLFIFLFAVLHVLSDAVENGTTFLWDAVKSSPLGKQKQNQPFPTSTHTHKSLTPTSCSFAIHRGSRPHGPWNGE